MGWGTADGWLRLQKNYDLAQVRQRERKISLSIHLLQCKESLRLRVPEMSGQLGTHNKMRALKVVENCSILRAT